MKSNKQAKNRRLRGIEPSELDSPERKLKYNRTLFSVVASRYDLVTRCLSLGSDHAWKTRLVAALPEVENPAVVDLACGTGDITIACATRYPHGTVIGLDITEDMLVHARNRGVAEQLTNIRFVIGDMNDLPFAPESVDIVTGGYALRNAPDLQTTLFEIYRVLRPGGSAAFLEFSAPENRLHRIVRQAILKRWGQLWGLFLHGDPEVYAYIARSLARFPDRSALIALYNRIGFTDIVSRDLFAGYLRISWMKKPSPT